MPSGISKNPAVVILWSVVRQATAVFYRRPQSTCVGNCRWSYAMTAATVNIMIGIFSLVVTVILGVAISDGPLGVKLPDTHGIDGQLTANHNIDKFFSLWLVFHNDDVKISDKPFTIFAPTNPSIKEESILRKPDLVKKLLLEHVVLGSKVDLTNFTDGLTLSTLGEKIVKIWSDNGILKVNNATIIERRIEVPNGLLIIIDDYLFPVGEIHHQEKSNKPPKASAAFSTSEAAKRADDSFQFPEAAAVIGPMKNDPQQHAKFVGHVLEVLSFLKNRVRVFQHFLARSNVSKLLKEGEEYTVFIPTDHAFQRWHPIDWGFYPFSVPEFTESIITNHFVKRRIKQASLEDGETLKTLGGRDLVFKKNPTLSVNGAPIIKGDTPVENGNIMFIGEVLFINESVVAKLHQQNKDKETPPLLAFPWFGAQFLSHAFLALERDKRFKHITRFLNLADLAPRVSGIGYTFFVPVDSAFEELGLDKMPDNYLSNGEGLQILLNHFVKGRLYNSDLKNSTQFKTLGNETVTILKRGDDLFINQAKIIETEVFVYNLGTMYYLDKVLFANQNTLPSSNKENFTTSTRNPLAEDLTPENDSTIHEEFEGEIDEATTTVVMLNVTKSS